MDHESYGARVTGERRAGAEGPAGGRSGEDAPARDYSRRRSHMMTSRQRAPRRIWEWATPKAVKPLLVRTCWEAVLSSWVVAWARCSRSSLVMRSRARPTAREA